MPTSLDNQNKAPVDLSLPEAIVAVASRKHYPIVGAVSGLIISVVLSVMLRPLYDAQVILAFEGGSGDQLGELARSLGGIASIAGVNLPAGGNGDRSSAIATLESYEAFSRFVEDEKLTDEILRETTRRFLPFVAGNQSASTWEAVRRLRKYLTVEELKPSGMIRVRLQWYEPQTAATWANNFARIADSILREAALSRSNQRLVFLQAELADASAVVVRDAISKVIENELRTMAFASVDKEFAFRVIDRAVPPERPIRPRRALLVAMITSTGALTGIVVALIIAVRTKRR